uniref:Uncharacterized protein n=1 Tax=Arundo donax TaxID=35708 RepID=A0A0A9EJ83_ARUDO
MECAEEEGEEADQAAWDLYHGEHSFHSLYTVMLRCYYLVIVMTNFFLPSPHGNSNDKFLLAFSSR